MRKEAAKVGPSSGEIGFSQLLPEEGHSNGQTLDRSHGLQELLRDLEQACMGKRDNLELVVDRKDAALHACRNWASNQMLPESVPAGQQAQPHLGSEWLQELVEREWVPGEVGSAAFRRLRSKILAEWREQRSSKESPRPAGERG